MYRVSIPLSWLAETPDAALVGIRKTMVDVLNNMHKSGEKTPKPLLEKTTAGGLLCMFPRKCTGL